MSSPGQLPRFACGTSRGRPAALPLGGGWKLSVAGRGKTLWPVTTWIETTGFKVVEIDEEVLNLSLRLEFSYEVAEESKGASQVDITLIAYAKQNQDTVVTLEGYQSQRPGKRANYKIPLICDDEGVRWLNFVQMLDEIGVNM